MMLSKIPVGVSMNTDNARLSPICDPFVDVEKYSGGRILADMKYIRAGYNGAIDIAYARRNVADKLLKAASLLPDGYRLLIYDAWRPYSVQKALYDEYFDKLAKDPANQGLSEEELHALAKKFVSFPVMGKALSYVHSSGGAIDLTLAYDDGTELYMGCGFDEFTPLASSDAYESIDCEARDNRRLLYTVMTEAGFTNYHEEWWHFDYGDLFWSSMTGNDAIYSSVYTLEEVKNG